MSNENTPLTDAQRKLAIVKRLRGTAEKWNTLSRKEQEVLFDVIDDLEAKLSEANDWQKRSELLADYKRRAEIAEHLVKSAEVGLALKVDAIEGLCDKVSRVEIALQTAEAAFANAQERLLKIKQWCDAYPLGVFPELDEGEWKAVHKILSENGAPSLDRISASNMRHVLEGISPMCALIDEKAIAQQTGTIGHVSHNMSAANAIAQQEKGER